jgi:hypothetical protein
MPTFTSLPVWNICKGLILLHSVHSCHLMAFSVNFLLPVIIDIDIDMFCIYWCLKLPQTVYLLPQAFGFAKQLVRVGYACSVVQICVLLSFST